MSERLAWMVTWAELARRARYRVKELAKLCGVSVRCLEKHVRQTVGECAREMIEKLRAQHAQSLLRMRRKLCEIAEEVGFANESGFCRWFRKRHGVTPMVWAAQGQC